MADGVPIEHQEAAEEIRAHLVALRGGAPFLSSSDARVLIGWLDQGVPVSDVLLALERAAEARRKTRSRIPLGLGQAKRHLGRVAAKAVAPSAGDTRPPADGTQAPTDHPLQALAEALEALASGPSALATKLLAADLLELPAADPEALLRGALARVRAFFAEAWEELPVAARAERVAAARAEVAALHPEASDEELDAVAEEIARDGLRRAWPLLSAAALWDRVSR